MKLKFIDDLRPQRLPRKAFYWCRKAAEQGDHDKADGEIWAPDVDKGMCNISKIDSANLSKFPDPRLCNFIIFHEHLAASADFAGHVQPRYGLQPWRWHRCWFRRGSQLVSARSWYGTHHGCSVSLFLLRAHMKYTYMYIYNMYIYIYFYTYTYTHIYIHISM